MSTYRYAVKVRHDRLRAYPWTFHCEGCGVGSLCIRTLAEARDHAERHAARCEALHWANWAAACPSCRRYGRVAPACPVCLGRGHIVEREVLT